MLNDFVPVIKKLRLADFPSTFTIVPLADAHYGSKEFNEARWRKTIKRIQDDPNCFCVLVGDLIDNGLKNSLTNVYEATCSPRTQKEWLAEELKPLAEAGKVIAACGGNHERRSMKEADLDPLYDVLVRLGIEEVYRPNICFLQVRLMREDDPKRWRYDFTYAITHGAGGGQYIGSSANRVQNFGMALEGIDCLVTGHTHKPLSFPAAKIVFENGRISRRQFVVAVASSFLDYGGYPVQKLMTPTAHTMTEIVMRYSRSNEEDTIKDIRVTQGMNA